MITLGEYRATRGSEEGKLRVLCEAPELLPHVHKPWFRAYLSEWTDVPLTPELEEVDKPRTAGVGQDLLARHACLCGSTGSGKTRLALHMLGEQLRAGCSVVMLDPKAETIRHLLQIAHGAGLPPERVTVLSPHLSGVGAPGWNPLDSRASGVPPVQAASDVVAVLEKSTSSWGPRLQDLLTNALLLIGAHGLSLWELARFLQNEEYRQGLLRLPLPHGEQMAGDPVALMEAREYFCQEFAAWSKSERASAVAPVLNKFRELLRSPFLRSLLCARRTTLNLAGLWQQPGLVLVHLDSVSLGEEGVRLLGGLMAHQLLRTALRVEGPVPVVLALDEMGISEQFVGTAASHILAIARSRGLRLLVACQHLAQLSEGLRAALLANTAVQAFFRLGPADAKVVAAALAAGAGEQVARVAVDVAKRDADGFPASFAQMNHTITDGFGSPVALSAAAWTAFRHLAKSAGGEGQVAGLKRLAGVSGVERLYVRAPGTKQPVELGRYVRGLGDETYHVAGPSPVRLVVTFPKPKLSVVARLSEGERQQRWQKVLMELPVRQAVLRLASGKPGVVRVAEVTDPASVPGFEKFVSAAVAGSGQSAKEIEEVLAWRREGVERVAAGSQMPLTTSETAGGAYTEQRLKSPSSLKGHGRPGNGRNGTNGKRSTLRTNGAGALVDEHQAPKVGQLAQAEPVREQVGEDGSLA